MAVGFREVSESLFKAHAGQYGEFELSKKEFNF